MIWHSIIKSNIKSKYTNYLKHLHIFAWIKKAKPHSLTVCRAYFSLLMNLLFNSSVRVWSIKTRYILKNKLYATLFSKIFFFLFCTSSAFNSHSNSVTWFSQVVLISINSKIWFSRMPFISSIILMSTIRL